MAYSSDSDIEGGLYADYVPRRTRIFNERRFHVPSVREFRERYRVPESVVDYLVVRIGDHLKHPSQRNNPLTPRQPILVFLHFIGTNGFYNEIQDCHGIGRDTVHRVVHRVIPLIVGLAPEFIKWPENGVGVALGFFKLSGMPNVCGAVDGSHINVIPPTTDEASYINRHHVHSLNVAMVCGPNLMIYFCSTKCVGRWHDAHVLRESNLWQTFEVEGRRPFPGAIILADSAYPCNEWLIPPLQANLVGARGRFNEAHKLGRNPAERTFGVVKNRFYALKTCIRLHKMTEASELTQCAFVLHSLCIHHGDNGEDFENDDNLPTAPVTPLALPRGFEVNERRRYELIRHFE